MLNTSLEASMLSGWKSRSVSKFHLPRLPQTSNILREKRAPRNFIKFNYSKPYRLVIKGNSPNTSPKTIQDEWHAIVLAIKISYRWPPGQCRHLYINADDRILKVPQSYRISDLSHLCHIKVTVNPCRGAPCNLSARCQKCYHVVAYCQAPPGCAHCEEHFWRQYEKRCEKNRSDKIFVQDRKERLKLHRV